MASNSKRRLVPLKTTLEVTAQEKVIDVYVISIPIKQASNALNINRRLIPNDGGLDLQHLRRFAKYTDVPAQVQTAISTARPQVGSEGDASPELLLVSGSIENVSKETLIEAMSSIGSPVPIYTFPVPLLAPTSQEQATRWTSQYWPTIYKKSNPFGPHPSLVSTAEESIIGDVEKWMDLAAKAARDTHAAGFGEEVGAVIISRENGIARPVAVAGDARWLDWQRPSRGNATAHAALRAIAMVAESLRIKEESGQGVSSNGNPAESSGIFRDQPLAVVERCEDSVGDDGYLCHDLEIYCTHEPCVMCAMAIVHSRFGRVVFRQRMPRTGGLCADGELGHGLFWRKELNWTLLAWHWASNEEDVGGHELLDLHA